LSSGVYSGNRTLEAKTDKVRIQAGKIPIRKKSVRMEISLLHPVGA
jgi:hypothetical protein